MKLAGKQVLVTGGATGLGRLLARMSLDRGARRVALWDIDEATLGRTADELRSAGHDVEASVVDVSAPEQVRARAAELIERSGPVEILFNNAGVVVGRLFHEHTVSEIEKTIRVNVQGVMHVAHAFLPAMIERGSGHVVNISSASGLLPNPRMSVYAGSKWAVLGWSDSLRLELERMPGDLHVTTIMPSYINTGMFDGVKAPLLTPILEPSDAARRIIHAVESDRVLLCAPAMVNLVPLLRGALPARVFDWLVGGVFGVYKTMDTFVGRAKNKSTAA